MMAINQTKTLCSETVLYKGIKCKVIYDYGNGNYEILFGEQIVLVHEDDIQLPI